MGPLRRLTAGGFVLALAAVAACGDIDANDHPFVGTVLYESPTGAFALRLLEPPWLPPLTFQGQTIFVVPPTDATISSNPTVVLSQALYSLQVQFPVGAPSEAMEALQAGLPGSAMAEQRPVRTASGATGVELSWEESAGLFHRDAFLAGAATPTFQLHFTAKHDIAGDAMVAQMIVSFEPK